MKLLSLAKDHTADDLVSASLIKFTLPQFLIVMFNLKSIPEGLFHYKLVGTALQQHSRFKLFSCIHEV